MGRRRPGDETESPLEREQAAVRWLRSVYVYLLPAADPPYEAIVRHMLAVRGEVKKLRRRMEGAGLPAVEIAAEVRALLEAEGLERAAAWADAGPRARGLEEATHYQGGA